MFTGLVYSRKPWTNTSSASIISSDKVNKKAPFTLAAFTQGFVCGFACDFKQCKQMYCTEELPKANCYSRLPYCLRTLRRDLTRLAFDSHLIRIWFNQMHLNQMQVQMQMRMNQMQMQVQMHPPRRNQVQVQMQMPHLHLHLQMQVHLSTSLIWADKMRKKAHKLAVYVFRYVNKWEKYIRRRIYIHIFHQMFIMPAAS